MKSFAVTLSGFRPRTTILTVSGTVSRTSRVIHELKMAVVPTPNATHPTAPACGVCESLPMMTMPGSACRSEEHTSELQSRLHLVCRLLLEKKKQNDQVHVTFISIVYQVVK